MFSCPPATTISAAPVITAWAASMTAFRPLPQTLLMVMAETPCGSPAFNAACRAGFCPLPAVSTWPKITSSICDASRCARSNAARITMAPSSGAATEASDPPNLPIAVLTAETITA